MTNDNGTTNGAENRSETILILAPTGSDAEIAERVLQESGLTVEVCREIRDICAKSLENAGLIFLTGEALNYEAMTDLVFALSRQPQWSDVPLVVLTSGGGDLPLNAEILDALGETANVTFIERPVRLKTLLSAVKSALRARRRQYDIRDHIADQKRTAAELKTLVRSEREARADAESANRLKDEFLATVSHELRTPLNAMLGWTNLLRTGRLDEQKTAKALETVERNARSQAQIIEDLLDVSRIITGKLKLDIETLDAAALVRSAIDSISPAAAAKNIALESNVLNHAGEIYGDSARLQQVLWNLLSNAVKFTPIGGSIKINLRREDANLHVSITDSGAGIEPEFLPFVFDRFRQADGSTTRHVGGLGLGLAIVRHLVEQHGGTVQAESEGAGTGATFTVKLPLFVPAQPNGKPPSVVLNGKSSFSQSFGASLAGLHVLVVDDEIDTLEIIKIFLESSGAEVATAQSVAAALAAIERRAPDVIVSDIGMPGADGYEFIEKVRRLAPEKGGKTPAIALTAYARSEDRREALRRGFQTHITKPVEMNELVAAVAALAASVESNL